MDAPSPPPARGDATANVMRLQRSFISTPIGDMLTLASDEGLCALEFTGPARPGDGGEDGCSPAGGGAIIGPSNWLST